MSDHKEKDPEAEDGQAPEGEEGAGKNSRKKLLLMILVPLVLLIGGGAGAYFMGYLDGLLGTVPAEDGAKEGHDSAAEGGHGEKKAEKKAESGHGGEKKEGEGGHGEFSGGNFVAIPPMLVNLNTEDGTPRYLRLTVQLELEDPADFDAVTAVTPRVIDQFQTYLRELRIKDLRGSAGIYRLQMELLWRVNQAAAPVKIKDVLFQEILIQ